MGVRLTATLVALEENIAKLEDVRLHPRHRYRSEYLSLIKRGTCFVPYLATGGIAFAPSRFVGYSDNSFPKHASNASRDGRKTNVALSHLLLERPIQNASLEREYRTFCNKLGITPSRTGTFGASRKFWMTDDIIDRLDWVAEDQVIADPDLSPTEKRQVIMARRGQGRFRDALLARWKRCCMTGCEIGAILRASHIKPWRPSSNKERLDEFNGLLLSPNMDALFDRGLISFSADGRILLGPEIAAADLLALGCDPKERIPFDRKHLPYLDYHRRNVFGKGPRKQIHRSNVA